MPEKKIIIINHQDKKTQEIVLDQDCLVFELLDQTANLVAEKTEIIIKDNINVEYVFVLQNYQQIFTETREIKLGSNSSLHNYYFYLNSSADLSLKQNLNTHSFLKHQVFVYLQEKQNFVMQEDNIFLEPNSQAKMQVFALALDQAKISYFSDLLIKKSAINTQARLEMEAFVWSKEAKINITPALSVEPSQVKASHAAKISVLSPEQLFYFNNRGLSEKEVKELLWRSLLEKLTSNITNQEIKEKIASFLAFIKFYE